MIRRRRLIAREVFVGVFPEVTEGSYTVWGLDGPLGEVTIIGGAVSEFQAGDLSDSPRDLADRRVTR